MYPRTGAALLPPPLRSLVGSRPVPPRLIARHSLPDGLLLGDLNADVWEELPGAAVQDLADEVAVALRRFRREVSGMRTRIFTARPTLDELELSSRARNALLLGGLVEERRLRPATIGRLATTPGVGVLSLLDVLSSPATGTGSWEHQPASGASVVARPSRAVKAAAATLVTRRWSPLVTRDDPRLGAAVRALHPDARTAREAGERLRDETFVPAAARSTIRRIRELTTQADALRRRSLATELDELVTALTPGDGARRVVLARTGLGGAPATTLEQAAGEIGVTRERARQIAASFEKALRARDGVWTPVLDRVLRAVRRDLPACEGTLRRTLEEAGLLPPAFSVLSLVAAARLLERTPLPAYQRELDAVVLDGTQAPVGRIRTLARRLVEHWGATTVDDVAAKLVDERIDQPLLALTLEALDGFRWLDRAGGWFWIRGPRNRLLNQVEKILSVAGSIELGELRTGTGRHYRMRGARLPRAVLAALCVDSGLYTFDGERVAGGAELRAWEDVLVGAEREIVEILWDHDAVMRSADLEQLAVGEGRVTRQSFYAQLSYSPVLERYAQGVWGLRGAPTTAARVHALIPPRTRTRVLQDHGWTADGQLWIAYRISAAAAHSGVLGFPVTLQSVARGHFELLAEDEPVGTLVADRSLWGLSPFFRRWHVEAGDIVVVTVDLTARRAEVEVGDDELLLRHQAEADQIAGGV